MSLPQEMRCLFKETEEEGYQLVKRPVPSPGPDDVIIKVDRVALCGSDINLWKWNETARIVANLPFIPGHETMGEVVALGDGVTDLKIGQRVAVENHFYCGLCCLCKENRGDICMKRDQYGHGRGTDQGGCSQYSRVPARNCYGLTTNLTANQAVLLEPMGVAHNAVESIEVKGENVLVLGCGPIGLFAIAVAKALGAREVFGVDVNPRRLKLAEIMGATDTIDGLKDDIGERVMGHTDGNGISRIIEASGAASLLNKSFSWLRKGGQMALIGVPKEPLHVENVLRDVILKSITLKAIYGRRIFHTWRQCERLIADGLVSVDPVISHEMRMTQYEQAFQLLVGGQACKIILDPQN